MAGCTGAVVVRMLPTCGACSRGERAGQPSEVDGLMPVLGPIDLPPCGVCRRAKVRVRRREADPVVLCLACDGGPLVDQARAQLSERQRRALNL